MFLRDLTLKGFKSFAEPCTLELEPGVTVVVGPNGSGKSNVVDAIAWVLGAQAPTSVRSQKMDDVIFAGTDKRPALGRAEVALTIDNSTKLLPVDFEEVTVTRTLFRSGDSEYAINGVPCRLLDIQELLSDAGVGRQQHVIVSQGQIDGVLSARPEDRRAIVDEAAGILKHRRRKDKALRRLAATEDNLKRVQDLLREVRRQLRPLERQADAARRHGTLIAELATLRIHIAGREIAGLHERRVRLVELRADTGRQQSDLRRTLTELDDAVAAAERQLGQLGSQDLGDDLARMEALRERIRGTLAVLSERARGVDRDRQTLVDQAIVASLEADATRMRAELTDVERRLVDLEPEARRVEQAEAELAHQRTQFEQGWGEGVTAPSGRAAQLRGELAALARAIDRDRSEHDAVEQRIAALDDKRAVLDGEADRLRIEMGAADAAEQPLVAELTEAEGRRSAAQAGVEHAEIVLLNAEREQQAWTARADALALAVDEARARSGAERLEGTAGVVGTLFELVEVEPGWEPAFEAAVGEALAAVVVDGADAGRRAVDVLRQGDAAGAVLALHASPPRARNRPPGAEALRDHVGSRVPGVEALLDLLVGDVAVAAGWALAVDLALANPGATVVTKEGDRFGPKAWRIGAAGTGATGAALGEAERRTEEADEATAAARRSVEAAQQVLAAARATEAELAEALDANDARLEAAGDGLQRVESERRDTEVEAEALGRHLEELAARLVRDRERVAGLEAQLPDLEAEEQEQLARGRRLSDERASLESAATKVSALRTNLEVRSAALDERRELLGTRLADVEARLERHAAERSEVEQRRARLECVAAIVSHLADHLAGRLGVVESHLEDLRGRRRRETEEVKAVTQRLDELRRQRQASEQQLAMLGEQAQRAEIDEAEVNLRLETAVDALRRDLDCEPARAVDTPAPPLPEGTSPEGRVRELERELRIMGPINPLALEEYESLKERYEFLEGQLNDVRASRKEVRKLMRAIDDEIVTIFAAAYADVADNFAKLFGLLFPGGGGKLLLTDPSDLLTTGIDVEARPSGKRVRKLSLLSGGERSLTALAFLFAVFRSRPSPFYVMDEVEAALDDVNLHRFLELVREFRDEAQLIVVSHQKRTMEAADCLIGVSMKPGASSTVITERRGNGALPGRQRYDETVGDL